MIEEWRLTAHSAHLDVARASQRMNERVADVLSRERAARTTRRLVAGIRRAGVKATVRPVNADADADVFAPALLRLEERVRITCGPGGLSAVGWLGDGHVRFVTSRFDRDAVPPHVHCYTQVPTPKLLRRFDMTDLVLAIAAANKVSR